MQNVLTALVAAFRMFFHPKMLVLLVWPMLLAIGIWAVAALLWWGSWIEGLTGMLQDTPLEQWIARGVLAVVSHYLISIILALLLLPAIYVTALVITAVFAMPAMVGHVAQKYYPELARRQGGSTAGSIANAALAIGVYGAGWVASLPLWLFSPLAWALPIILMAYLNQRLFRYDALAEHASREEYAQVIKRAAPKLYLLGAIAAVLQLVPLLTLFLPVYVGLAFIHLCLAELQQLRHSSQDVS